MRCPASCKVTARPTKKAARDHLGPMIQFIKITLKNVVIPLDSTLISI